MTIDYDRRSLEAARFADREAAQDERPRWRRFALTEAGEDIGYAYGFSEAHVVHSVTLLRRRDGLATSDLRAVEADTATSYAHDRNSVATPSRRV